MTELVRTLRSGSVGLDLVLGGGPRLLNRMDAPRSESATLLVRGGPGTGKSVLATDTALRLARALDTDVLYVCVEILPREILAQRMGFDGFDPAKAIDLARPDARKTGEGPTLVVGMRGMEMAPPEEGEVPDLGGMILDLMRISRDRDCDPRVVVVDSLSDGYHLGAEAPRETVDGVCKLAVQQGWVLVLVEEAVSDRPSPWSFAVDTVLSLDVTPAGRRELRVTKHRFASSQPGPHRLLIERDGVRVIPCFAAYKHAVRDLALPPPATHRSLRVPVAGPAPDWTRFNVPDGEGRVVVVHGTPPNELEALATSIGKVAQDGSAHPGARGVFYLLESHDGPLDRNASGFHVRTLHQMIDGEEWLEAVLSVLAADNSAVARVRIGPTNRLRVYEHADTLRKAISLFAAILARKGLVVVVYGQSADDGFIRAIIVNEDWTVSAAKPPAALKVVRTMDSDKIEFKALVT
jgi:KaiC/GvpD/RAD55 family RecA-like ATPase